MRLSNAVLFLLILNGMACSNKQAEPQTSATPKTTSEKKGPTTENAAPPLPAEELVEVTNPQYLCWEKQEVGTVVTLLEVSTFGDSKTESTTTYRLKSKTDDKIVVEQSGQIIAPDGTVYPPTTQDFVYLKVIKLPKSRAKTDLLAPEGVVESKQEAIEVLGKTYQAMHYRSKGRVEAGETMTSTWIVAELPHGIVKTIHDIPGAKKRVTSEITKIELQQPN